MTLSDDGVGFLVANVVLPFLAAVAVALRFAARIMKGTPLKMDDWTILVCLIISTATCAASGIYGAAAGIHGVSWELMTRDTFILFRKMEFSDILICHFVFGLTKISVVLFYKRIFTTRRFVIAANIILAAITLFILVSFFTILFCARGVSTFWSTPPQLEGTQYVIDPPSTITAIAVLDITLDIAVLSLPLPVIKSLHMSSRKRWYVAGIFLLGAFCLVCSLVRLYYVRSLVGFTGLSIKRKSGRFAVALCTAQPADGTNTVLSDDNDLWAHIEACASVFTACLPTLGPLFNSKTLDSMVGSFRSLFSLRSRSTFSLTDGKAPKKGNASENSEPDTRGWYELNPKGVTKAKVTHDDTVFDPESQSQGSDTIMVHKSYASETN
ncbi:hypothetical protein HYFRA_00006116 [Hymenoscyphus fraxineus]|uniref:Rhodopsin domain-containing protein n=1 Tax=Hymenoscyphus fraxineus TaxID=746836 RepID=A0A9N9Q1A6_9HELO|nr:hypothetical protein HYFRA_00006116 [Hymenoscyphus fraxineus]